MTKNRLLSVHEVSVANRPNVLDQLAEPQPSFLTNVILLLLLVVHICYLNNVPKIYSLKTTVVNLNTDTYNRRILIDIVTVCLNHSNFKAKINSFLCIKCLLPC